MTTRQEVEAMVEKDGNMLLTSKAQVQEAWDAGARVYGYLQKPGMTEQIIKVYGDKDLDEFGPYLLGIWASTTTWRDLIRKA